MRLGVTSCIQKYEILQYVCVRRKLIALGISSLFHKFLQTFLNETMLLQQKWVF